MDDKSKKLVSKIPTPSVTKNAEKVDDLPKYIYTGEELLNLETDGVPCLLEKILPNVAVGALGGSSDTGKSTFLRQFAMAVVSGEKEFLGFKINAHHNDVIYVSTEDDEIAISHLMNLQNVNKYNSNKYKNLRYIFNSDNLIDTLKKELLKAPTDCIIIDAFSDIYGDDLNSSNKVRKFINDYYNIAKVNKCLLLFLHHTGKNTERFPPHKDLLLGSQGFEAKMRVVIEIRRDFLNPNHRHLCIVKGNYIPSEMKTHSYVLKFENMVYTQTNKRLSLALLKKPKDKDKDKEDINLSDTEVRVMDLFYAGNSYREIEAILMDEGIVLGKSQVGNIINKHKKKGSK